VSHPWLQSYPPGLAPEIGPLPAASIGEHLVNSCNRYRTRTACISMGTRLSFTELERRSRDFAAWLQHRGLPPGTRIALMLPNILPFPIALFGALRAGLVIVNCSPLYSARELEAQLIDSGAEAIVILEHFADCLHKALPRTQIKEIIMTGLGDQLDFPKNLAVNFTVKHIKKSVPTHGIKTYTSFNTALKKGRERDFTPPPITPDDLAFLQYTGGTTGVHKAAMLTHGNLLANMLQTNACFDLVLDDHEHLMVTALPLYHIFALTVNGLLALNRGVTSLMIANPKDIGSLITEMGRYPFDIITGVNTLYNALLNHPRFHELDFSKLRITVGGGMAVQKAVAERWQAVTGCTLAQGYGLTETSPVASLNPLTSKSFNGSIGLPLPSTRITIRNNEGEMLPTNTIGELCIQGPQVMKGYWNRIDETREVFHADGALKTGDLGFQDEAGFTTIVDRKKDMILVSGYNVYPNEVEDVVALHPGVKEVAAIGVPHKFSGEVVKIFVIKKDPTLNQQDLMSHCRAYLASHKVPRKIEFREDLPRSNVGKVLRRALREAESQS